MWISTSWPSFNITCLSCCCQTQLLAEMDLTTQEKGDRPCFSGWAMTFRCYQCRHEDKLFSFLDGRGWMYSSWECSGAWSKRPRLWLETKIEWHCNIEITPPSATTCVRVLPTGNEGGAAVYWSFGFRCRGHLQDAFNHHPPTNSSGRNYSSGLCKTTLFVSVSTWIYHLRIKIRESGDGVRW